LSIFGKATPVNADPDDRFEARFYDMAEVGSRGQRSKSGLEIGKIIFEN